MSNLLVVHESEEIEPSIAPDVPEDVARIARGPRVLGDLKGRDDGPILICVGGIHGNEPAGALALDRLFRRLESRPLEEMRGRFVGLVGNRQALGRGRRYLHHDLNRFWTRERAERLRERAEPLEAEAEELRQLDHELERILAAGAERRCYLLDLHTTSGDGPAFANLDDTLPNRVFALEFPVPLVVGIEEELAGTLTAYLFDRGLITLGFESGQHQEERAVGRAEAAIWIALEASGVLARGSRPEAASARELLKQDTGSLPHVVEVLHRHLIETGDEFRMLPGLRSFESVRADQVLARDHRGEVRANFKGMILMPLYQEQGQDGFFIVREVRPLWLKMSEYVRRFRLERFLHLLPGVRPNPALAGSFTVDRRYARFFALEIFHLLGFRRHSEVGRYLVMARRAHDR